jgi:hypothetical protein
MAGVEIDEDVRTFLREHVASYEELDALLDVARAEGGARLPEELVASVRMSLEQAEEALSALARRGLLARAGPPAPAGYRLAAASPDRLDLLRRLARIYADRRLEVIKVMTASSIDRLRTSALKTFDGPKTQWGGARAPGPFQADVVVPRSFEEDVA